MKKIAKGFSIILVMTILSKIASFLSEMVIAYLLGTSEQADTYSIIIGIHQVIFPMIGVGIWSVFLPYYKKKIIKSNSNDVNAFVNRVVTLFLLFSILIVAILNIFPNQIIYIVANGFSEKLRIECAMLLRIYSPYVVFVIISSVYAAILQANEKFFASQIREVVSYLPTIFIGPIAYEIYGVKGLVAVLIIGGIFRLVILLPFLDKKQKFKFDFNFSDNSIKDILIKMPAALIASGIEQINVLIDKMMASNLNVGSVSSLNYGNKLINVFNGFFSSAISTVLYPIMSQYVVEDRHDELKKMIKNGLIAMAIIIIPISILAILLKEEIVTFVFARGKFALSSVDTTSMAFMGYLIGMYYVGVKQFLNNIFYSFGDTKTTMKISLIVVIINIILNILFTKLFGLFGLSLATSISSILYFILSIIIINKKLKIDIQNIFKSIFKIYIISIISICICFVINDNIISVHYILRSIIVSLVFLIIYIIGLKMLNIEEKNIIINFIKKKEKKI